MRPFAIIFVFSIVFTANFVFAQYARFPVAGTVEYEKSINMFAVLKKRTEKDKGGFMTQLYESYKKTQPQFKKVKSTLSFTDNKTLYTPHKSNETNQGFFNDEPAAGQHNIIYTDLTALNSVTQKNVFEETFLVKDSTRKINWKITNETREIAGYSCRRANAIILDSIYVVAFYSDKIPVSGGPESFTGLPGMILGVALPHENITWFATKVTDTPVAATALIPPKKGKPTDVKGLVSTLQGALKKWGDYAQSALKAFLL
ncbi:MAG TPA: GLPGLI family protein [Sphingobacteriaceae bacterium]|nr:GLPGLI family protein [Sphingobacteriaceae bacterium]